MDNVAVVAMDIHKKFSKAVALDAQAQPIHTWNVDHGDYEVMQEFFRQFAPGTDVVMEATFNWPWIADVAQAMGMSAHLAHAQQARRLARNMAKSDRKDAIFLGKLYLSTEIFPKAYLAPPQVRRMRAHFRQRLLLVGMRVMLKNALHGQLLRLGIVTDEEVSDLFSPKGRRVLGELELLDHERDLMELKLKVIDQLSKHIKAMEQELVKEIREDPRGQLLMSLPGVGCITAYSWLAEIGELERFPNGRALAAYAGCLPMEHQSADKDFGKHTSVACNKFLRWAAIEAVSGAARASARMKSLHSRVKARNPKQPGKARIAVVRELLELAHLLLSRQVPYTEKRPPRPGAQGRRSRRKSFSSESGQPDRRMRPSRIRDQAEP